jgi:hypothetical protein
VRALAGLGTRRDDEGEAVWLARAVERYRERIEPVAYDVALGRLIRASADARLAKRYPDGQALYRTGKPDRLAFVVAPCAEPGERSHAIVTVLGPPARSAT